VRAGPPGAAAAECKRRRPASWSQFMVCPPVGLPEGLAWACGWAWTCADLISRSILGRMRFLRGDGRNRQGDAASPCAPMPEALGLCA